MNSKLICIIGAPHSGKSTLASQVHTSLKKINKNSIFVGEYATDFIANSGIPDNPIDQIVIFYKQQEKEKLFINSKEFIICDSSTLLNYLYFRILFPSTLSSKDITVINHIQREVLKNINSWFKIYYVPPIINILNVDDGIRYHNNDQINKIDRWIKSYLEIENIPHIDLSKIDINDRKDFIINDLNEKE